MKQTKSLIYFSFSFLLAAGMMLLLAARQNVAAEAGNKPAVAITSDISSAFTYQGTLNDNGSPANGQYDFVFTLLDAATTPANVLSSTVVDNVMVTNGRFTVELDVESQPYQAYAGLATWLEIWVRPAGTTTYETLTPRQPLTAAPLALSLPNVYTNPATDHVGIGTFNPITSETFTVKAPTTDSFGGMYVATSGSNGRPFYGYSANGTDAAAFHYYDGESSEWRLSVGGNRMIVKEGETAIIGDVTQGLNDDGLVKAAAVVTCSNFGSNTTRFFNNVNDAPLAIANGPSVGRCTLHFGFDIDQRYWSVTSLKKGPVDDPQPYLATCVAGSPSSLNCKTFDLSGNGINGAISVIIH